MRRLTTKNQQNFFSKSKIGDRFWTHRTECPFSIDDVLCMANLQGFRARYLGKNMFEVYSIFIDEVASGV